MRRRINWYELLCDLHNPEIIRRFLDLAFRNHNGKYMSSNRCAYNVLKTYYSTTTIDQLCEKLGV